MFVFVAASLESATNQAFGRWIVVNWTHISPAGCVMEQAPGLGFGQPEWDRRTEGGSAAALGKCVVRAFGIVFGW